MPEESPWPANYFNYFTEVEEHFQKSRGTGLFLMSPLDWALVESWKNAGVPLEAVLRGVEVAFDKWRSRKQRTQMVNSLAYCSQAVLKEASTAVEVSSPHPKGPIDAPFSLQSLQDYLKQNGDSLRARSGFEAIVERLDQLFATAVEQFQDLESLEQLLTTLEEKMVAIVRTGLSDDDLLEARRRLDSELRPYRGKMSAEQLSMLERQYLDRFLFEKAKLPRLSLFYLF